VVLTDTEEVEAEIVSQDGLADDVADDLRLRHGSPLGVDGDVAEGVQPELELLRHDWCNKLRAQLIPRPAWS
jgi:hypothetical protein